MGENSELLFKTRVWLSLRTKLLLLFVILLASTIGANIHYSTSFFISDKTAYIYETGLNKSQILASRLNEIILRIVDNSITLGNVLNTTGTTNVNIELSDDMLALILLKNEDGEFKLDKIKINDKQMDKLSKQYEIDADLFIKKVISSFEAVKNNNKKINIISLLKDHLIPAVAIGIKKDEQSYFLNISNIAPIITDMESDALYTNTIIDLEGQPLFSNLEDNKRLHEEKYIRDIISSDVKNGSRKVITNAHEEKLVSFSKIPTLDLILLSEINSTKAFKIVDELKYKSILFGLFILGIAMGLVIILSKTITSPMKKLVQGITSISKGDFSTRVKIFSLDETRILAAAFNYMAERITELIKEMVEKARLEKEVENAKVIQDTLFPPTNQVIETVKIHGLYKSASECNGDWWYYEQIGRDLYFFIGDATGHGVPAALLTASVRATLATLSNMNIPLSPATIMRSMNHSVYSTSKGQIYMTFFIGRYNFDTRNFTYCNASHNSPYQIPLSKEDTTLAQITPFDEVCDPRLGESMEHEFKEASTTLTKNDVVLFYTDGIVEVENENNRQLGEKKFMQIVLDSLNKNKGSLKDCVESVRKEVYDFKGVNNFDDDITYYFGYFG